jgi:hypothetical protein
MTFCLRRNLTDYCGDNKTVLLLLYSRLRGLSVRSLARRALALGHCREAVSVRLVKTPRDDEGWTEKCGIRNFIAWDLDTFTEDESLSQSIPQSSSAFAITQSPGGADQAPALGQISCF